MKTRHYILGSVAVAALMGTMVLGGPAFAQRYSSPEEQAQTRSLNDQAEPGTTATPDQLNGEQPLARDQGEYQGPGNALAKAQVDSQVQAQNDDAQQRYEEQQDDYARQREHYLNSKDAYDAKRAQYDNDKADYNAQFAPPAAFPRDPRLVRLGSMEDPRRALRDVPVDTLDGEHIGRVVAIQTQGGDPVTVEVGVGRGRVASVAVEDLRFDRDRKVVVSALSRDELLDGTRP